MKKIQIATTTCRAEAGEWMALHDSPGPFMRPPKRGVPVTIPMKNASRFSRHNEHWSLKPRRCQTDNIKLHIQVPWYIWEAKLRVVVFGVLMNYHCNLFYLNMKFSIIFPYCFKSRRGVIERCVSGNHATPISSQALRRPQESGEEAKARVRKSTNWLYEFVWITWEVTPGVTLCCCSAPPCESLKPWISRVLLTSCHPLCSWRHWRPLQTSSRGSWQRRKKKRGKVPLRLHTLHQMIITIIDQTQLHEIQSCLLMQPLLFCLDFVIQDRAGLLPMLFVRPRAHQRLWKNSLRASQATKCPSVVSLDKEHHILILI